jgi:hypothetical protein
LGSISKVVVCFGEEWELESPLGSIAGRKCSVADFMKLLLIMAMRAAEDLVVARPFCRGGCGAQL